MFAINLETATWTDAVLPTHVNTCCKLTCGLLCSVARSPAPLWSSRTRLGEGWNVESQASRTQRLDHLKMPEKGFAVWVGGVAHICTQRPRRPPPTSEVEVDNERFGRLQTSDALASFGTCHIHVFGLSPPP